jgi:peptidoglycan hydrolase-like protein with peptidoglycan-binding domain
VRRRELVEHVARTLRPMRGESWAILRGAADAVARAELGEPLALAFAEEARRSRRVAKLLEQARAAMLNAGGVEADGDETTTGAEGDAYSSEVAAAALRLDCLSPGNVLAFQEAYSSYAAARGLKPLARTSVLDRPTQVALSSILASSERSGAAELEGAAAADMQASLNRLGFFGLRGRPLRVDGRIGPQTRHALRAFQAAEGMAADGVPSADTLHWLSMSVLALADGMQHHASGYSSPGHAYGPPRPPFRLAEPDPYCPECPGSFRWHGRATAEVPVSPRQLGDPLYAKIRTPWLGAQGLGAQYVMHDQDVSERVPTPAYRWHWLERNELEGERS